MESRSIKEVLADIGIRPSKKKGQNFLFDRNILDIQLREAKISPGDVVLEVGPGLGFLTVGLLKAGARVIAVEKDPLLYHYLRKNLQSPPENIELIMGDILKVDLPRVNKVVSNIPYGISSPFTFLLEKLGIESAVIMYQYEFARRLTAVPRTREYSRLSVMSQYLFIMTFVKEVSKNVFYPRPRVNSAIVKMERRKGPPRASNYGILEDIVRAAFSSRRKKMKNALASCYIDGIDRVLSEPSYAHFMDKRAEELRMEDYVSIANSLAEGDR